MTLLSHLREINKVRKVKRRNKLVCEVRRDTNVRLPRVLPVNFATNLIFLVSKLNAGTSTRPRFFFTVLLLYRALQASTWFIAKARGSKHALRGPWAIHARRDNKPRLAKPLASKNPSNALPHPTMFLVKETHSIHATETVMIDIPLYYKRGIQTGGGEVIPYKRLIGMCRWMGSHFHDWSDFYGVEFSIELLEWGRTFSDFGVRQFFIFTVSN